MSGKPLHLRHHKCAHVIYRAWEGMIARCYNPKHTSFRNYGGRGIGVCEEWRYAGPFIEWSDSGWAPGLSLDRIDNNLDYSPTNCRWATKAQQVRNIRRNIWCEYNGERMIAKDAAVASGINYGTLRCRLKAGWPNALALSKRSFKGIKGLSL